MSKFSKFMILAIPVLSFGIYMGYRSHMKPVEFSAEGVVSKINWKTKNHEMPLIEINDNNCRTKKFTSNRIVLSPDKLRVGDLFKKISGTQFCHINEVKLQCVN
ncbi:hypothetical protein [uncultured Paraglaciecola sp.]|uniref:hypothetical protein n=1 Tax=uncultured Paraglaciecola sp. TaxID=1765024 RepID=UPI0025E7612F|nr:hypothetical protein [uncultured Paraglaciecola sp.]